MASHKIVGACGKILCSFIEDRQVFHELTPLCIQKKIRKQNFSVSLHLQKSPWGSWAAPRKALRIRKVVLGAKTVPTSQIVDEVSKFYCERGGVLIAARIRLNNGRSNMWINPMMVEALGKMEMAKAKMNAANGNARVRRFWEKLLRMEEFDARLSCERLRNEVQNFSQAFTFVWD